MRIHILVTDGVFDLGLAALRDTLALADALAGTAGLCYGAMAPLQVALVGAGNTVTSGLGMSAAVHPFGSLPAPDAVMVPALGCQQPEALDALLRRPELQQAMAFLRGLPAQRTWTGAACTGTWLLAGSGLLDGHRATTSWWLADAFRARFPDVALDDSRVLVASAPFVTAGAALAHVDLALALVRSRSPALAALTARYLLAEPRVSQATFRVPDHPADRDAVTQRFERWARSRLADGFSLAEAASSIGTSPRTLGRRLQQSMGKSPLAYFQDLRVDQAVHLLRTTDQSVEQIAVRVGYAEGVTLRTLLRRKLGVGVKELRRTRAG